MIRVHVRRRSDSPNWELYYRDPLTGKKVRKSSGTPDRREADRAAARWEKELESGRTDFNCSWDAFRAKFTAEFLDMRPESTQWGYRSALNRFEEIIGNPRHLSAITPSVVSQFASKLTCKPATKAKHLRHLRAALKWAESMELIHRAPHIQVPRTTKRRLARSRCITWPECRRMLRTPVPDSADPPEAWRSAMRLMWLSGLRISEAMRVCWDSGPIQVDLDGGKFPRLIWWAEGQKARRDEITLLAPDCARWLRKHSKRFGPVVPLSVSGSRASHVIADIGKAAGIETAPGKFASAQDFRRAFGQRWAPKVRPLTLMRMMRHRTIEVTLKYYVDLDADDIGAELYPRL